MQKKLAEFETLSKKKQDGCNLQVVKLKTRIEEIDKEISSLLAKITSANDTVMQYINNRITELDAEKKELYTQITQFDETQNDNIGEISGYLEHWDELSISDKITVVDCLIERITASKENIEIKWMIYNFFIAKAFHHCCSGEALRLTTDRLNEKNFYAFNPNFDTKPCSRKMM